MVCPSGGLSPRQPSIGRQSNGSSDFVLLTTESSPLLAPPGSSSSAQEGGARPSSRPRLVILLQFVALIDFVTTFALALRVPIRLLPKSAVAANLARAVVVGAVLSRRASAKEVAPVLLGQLVVSALVLLFRLNELVQTTTLPPDAWLNPTTIWYLVSFLFAPLHYVLFLLLVGLPRRGRGRSWATGEQAWAGTVERVSSHVSVRSGSGSAGLVEADEGARAPAHWNEEGSGSDRDNEATADAVTTSDDDDDDDDDIIDVPRPYGLTLTPGLRNRASRASLLSAFSPPPAPGTAEGENDRPGFGASRGFGSIRSLAGI